MPDSELDQIVDEYLGRLKVALADLPPEKRQQLIVSITDHISEARSTLHANSEVAVRDILDRVGQPEDIAAEALGDQTTPMVLRSTRIRRLATIGVAVVVVLGIVLGTFLATRINNATPGAPPNETTSTVPNGTASTTTLVSRVIPSVVGLTLRVAEVELQIVRFRIVVIFRCRAGISRPGLVMSQSPVSGMSAAAGSQVRITTSPPNCP
jgi:uncharacterized membrane protein